MKTIAAALAFCTALTPLAAGAADAPGVTATEIKIGQTMPYSGPASAYAAIGRGEQAYFKMVNDHGGINGRKVVIESADDGYNPAKTVEETRRLVEREEVAFMFNSLGTSAQTSVQKYLNGKKIPQLFVSSGADKWGDYAAFPWTMGWQPSYRTEAQIYAKYLIANKPGAKIAVLYQNDDFGKDYVSGLRDVFGAKYDQMVVKTESYEVTDPTMDQQIVSLQGSGADALVIAATPKFAAQAIRKVYDLGWKPQSFVSNVSASVGAVLTPVGPEKAVGLITAAYLKDWTDPHWHDDAGMKKWHAFMQEYMAGSDETDANYSYAYSVSQTLEQVLKQCGADLSRENIMKQAASVKDLETATLLPGIRINTGAANYHPIRQMQLTRFNGKAWDLFGDLIEGSGS
jgi:branched-chain amino acid transport system substrate-binding protein